MVSKHCYSTLCALCTLAIPAAVPQETKPLTATTGGNSGQLVGHTHTVPHGVEHVRDTIQQRCPADLPCIGGQGSVGCYGAVAVRLDALACTASTAHADNQHKGEATHTAHRTHCV